MRKIISYAVLLNFYNAPSGLKASTLEVEGYNVSELERVVEPIISNNRRNAADVFDALSYLPAVHWGSLVDLIKAPETRLDTDDQWNIGNVIRALIDVPAHEWRQLVGLFTASETRLITEDRRNAESLIKTLKIMTAPERVELVHLIIEKNLIMDDRRNAADLIDALSWAPASQRQELVELTDIIISSGNYDENEDQWNIGDIIRALRNVPAAHREALVNLITEQDRRIVDPNLKNAHLVISALADVPSEEWEDFIILIMDQKTRLVSDDLGNASQVIDALKRFTPEERAAIAKLVTSKDTRLLTSDRRNAHSVISALKGVPAEEREALVELIKSPSTLLVSDGYWNTEFIIQALSNVPVSERASLVSLILAPETRLVTDNLENADSVISSLSQVPAEERRALVALMRNQELSFISDSRDNSTDVIEALRLTSVSEREELVDIIIRNRLLKVDRGNAGDVIRALSWLTPAERIRIVTLIKENQLILDDRRNVSDVIWTLRDISNYDRVEFVRLIKENNLLNDDLSNIIDLFLTFSHIPESERASRALEARSKVIALPWWNQGMTMTGRQRQEFNLNVIAALEGIPVFSSSSGSTASEEEAIYIEADAMRETFSTLLMDPRSSEIIIVNLPKAEDLESSFHFSSTQLNSALQDILTGEREGSELYFRISQALRTIKLLQGDTSIEHHPISSIQSYMNFSQEGLPNIRQLYVLAWRLLQPIEIDKYIKSWMGENLQKLGVWRNWGAAFGNRFPGIATQGNVSLALGADGEKGEFVRFLSQSLIGENEDLNPNMGKAILPLKRAFRDHRRDRLMPLIEALFMVMRGHNSNILEPTESNIPACAAGAYLNILKAITQTPRIVDVAAHKLEDIEIQDCARPQVESTHKASRRVDTTLIETMRSMGSISSSQNENSNIQGNDHIDEEPSAKGFGF